MKRSVITLLVLTGLSQEAFPGVYPAPSYQGPAVNPVLPWADSFSPPITNDAPNANAPRINEWSKQGLPGDALVLTGERLSRYEQYGNVEGFDSAFVFYAQGVEPTTAHILRQNKQQAAVRVSEELPADQMYLMWPRNKEGYGRPVAINQTELWWIGHSEIEQGKPFYAYGQNLQFSNGVCRLYLEEVDVWLESVSGSKYKAEFIMPASIPAGSYTAYAHNGSGGRYGWSMGFSIEVIEPFSWSGAVYNILDYGAVPNDGQDDQAAFEAVNAVAKSDSGSTVYFPEGTYNFSDCLGCNKRVRYVGAGMGKTFVTSAPNRNSGRRLMEAWGDRIQVKDMSILLTDDIDSSKPLLFGYKSDITLERVEIDDRQSKVVEHSILRLDDGKRSTLKDCRFYLSHSLIMGEARDSRIIGCEFIGIDDCNQMLTLKRARFIDISHCEAGDLDQSDASEKDGWSKGRWITGSGASWDVYVGGNSTRNMAPRLPVYFFEGLEPSQIDSWDSSSETMTLHFSSIPDDVVNRGNSIRMFIEKVDVENSAAQEKLWRLKGIDEQNKTITFSISGWQSDWFRSGDRIRCHFQDDVDRNSGEHVMAEGLSTRFSEYVISAESKRVTVANSSGRLQSAKDSKASMIHIVKGKGLGQCRKVLDIDVSAGTVLLEKPWEVEPDSTSIVNIGSFLHNFIVYGNSFDGRPDAVVNQTALVGFQPYGGSSSMIVDSNIFTDMRKGVAFYSLGSKEMDSDYTTMGQNFFNHVENNTFSNCFYDIYQVTTDNNDRPLYETDVAKIGNVFRRNRSTGALGSAYFMGMASGAADDLVEMNIYDQNHVENFNTLISEEQGLLNQVWVGNTFVGQGGTGYSIAPGHEPVLYDNDWVGFSSTYGGALPGGALELPVRLLSVEEGGAPQAVKVHNSGTESISVAAESGASWLNVTAVDDDVAAEEVMDAFALSVNEDVAPEIGEEAIVTVTAGSQIKQMTVVYGDGGAVPPPPGPPPAAILTELEIAGPVFIDEESEAQFYCTGYFSDGSSSAVDVDWSEDTVFASIDSDGVLLAGDVTSDQTLTVTATLDGKSARFISTIRYIAPTLTRIEITGPASVEEESSATFSCLGHFSDGSVLPVEPVWSENSGAVVIDDSGELIAGDIAEDQTVLIIAQYEDQFDSVDVLVRYIPPELTGLVIVGQVSVDEEQSVQYACVGSYDDGTTAVVQPSWSEDSSIALISDTGLLTVGNVDVDSPVILTASLDGFVASLTVLVHFVEPYITAVKILGSSSVGEESTVVFTCEAIYSDGTHLAVTPGWSAAGSAAISNSGLLTPANVTADSTATITAEYQGFRDTLSVAIIYAEPDVVELIIAGQASMEEGTISAFSCAARYSDGTYDENVEAEWSVDSTYATVSELGELSAGNVSENQSVELIARFGGASAAVLIDILYVPPAAVITGISIEGVPSVMNENSEVALSCSAQFSDGTSRPAEEVVWSVSGPAAIGDGLLKLFNVNQDSMVTVAAAVSGLEDSIQIDVLAIGTQVIYPLDGYAGKIVRARLWDETAQEWHELGEMNSPAELIIENVNTDQWYWISISEFDEGRGEWTITHGNWLSM